jgi:anti-anti-sigma factor
MDMDVTELAGGSVTFVRLHGRLDAAGADRVGLRFTAAVAALGKPAVVDLSGVAFIASMGMRLLISAAKGARLRGHKVALFGAQPQVGEVLDEAALDQILDIVATEEEALARVA